MCVCIFLETYSPWLSSRTPIAAWLVRKRRPLPPHTTQNQSQLSASGPTWHVSDWRLHCPNTCVWTFESERMEEVILRKLDEMFSDLRQEIQKNHLLKVHPQKEQHQGHCLSSRSNSNFSYNRRQSIPNHVTSNRRLSMPAKLSSSTTSSVRRGSLPVEVEGRRSSLPTYPIRRLSADLQPQRRESTISRKFSRDSLDLDLVIEDASEADADSDYNNSVIVEEDEEADIQVCRYPMTFVPISSFIFSAPVIRGWTNEIMK